MNGVITTVADIGGSYGFIGDGGIATSANLCSPQHLSFDSSGNMYIADMGNNVIRKVDVTGVITTVAGIGGLGSFGYFSGDGGLATSATLKYPNGVFIDTSGNMYIADLGNYAIRKIDANGVITTVAGIGGSGGESVGYSGDGGLATSAKLNNPS
jgi:sugar lactone lactonase YvrE